LSIINDFLLAFGGVALFVGGFVIANTLSITIAQRTRELATLRTLGATRRQVLRSVLLEAFIIGALASVTGLFLGLALAKGLNKLFVHFGIDLPQAGTVFATRTIVVSLVVGIVITLIAALRPAIRATRVPPISAVREGAVLPTSRFARFSVAAALITIGGAVALMSGLALVTLGSVLASGLKTSFENAVNSIFTGQYAVTATDNFSPISTASANALERVPGVQVVSGVRAGQGKAFGHRIGVT